MKSRVYPNGFLFTKNRIEMSKLPEYYIEMKIIKKYYYYYDKYSDKIAHHDGDYFIIIHGLYAHIDIEKGNVTDESHKILLNLYRKNRELFLDNLDFLAGRFVIIIGNNSSYEVFGDASGMRSVFYSNKNQSIGSHINLMADVINLTEDTINKINSESFKIWDNTQYSDLKSINPNFYYSSHENSTSRFFPRKNNKYRIIPHEQRLKIFEFLWKEQLSHFKDIYETIIFSITGGADSRVSLSLAKEHIKEMKFFTYAPSSEVGLDDSNFSRALSKDKNIVDQILDNIPLNHRYLLFRENKIPLKIEELDILDKNTVLSHGRYLLAQYNYYFTEDSILHIRGNLFEIGRAYFIKSTSKNDSSDIYKLAKLSLSKPGLTSEEEKVIDKHLSEKISEFNYDSKLHDYHLLDLYYWEIRMGRWMSEVLNETDLSFETLLPFNMRALMDISLSYSIEERRTNYMFNEIINKNYPILNFFGKNDVRNLYEQQFSNVIKSTTKNEKTNIISSFNLYLKDLTKVKEIQTKNNTVYIPIDHMGEGNFSQTKFNFKKQRGNVKLSILNKYSNKKGKGYLKYQVLINREVLLEEDLAMWAMEIDLVLLGLKKEDEIILRVISNRKSNTLSWERASKTEIISYTEISQKEILPIQIFSNSPFSIIY